MIAESYQSPQSLLPYARVYEMLSNLSLQKEKFRRAYILLKLSAFLFRDGGDTEKANELERKASEIPEELRFVTQKI